MSEYVFEITVKPNDGTSGTTLNALLSALDVRIRFRRVIIADIECNGDRSWCRKEPFELTVIHVMDFVPRVGQFDWATLFFLEDSCPIELTITNSWFNQLFGVANLVVRAVDSTWFIVYSIDEGDASSLLTTFAAKVARKSKESIVHPF